MVTDNKLLDTVRQGFSGRLGARGLHAVNVVAQPPREAAKWTIMYKKVNLSAPIVPNHQPLHPTLPSPSHSHHQLPFKYHISLNSTPTTTPTTHNYSAPFHICPVSNMRFQFVTTAAALLVAVAALPTPRPDSHGLVPDTDDVVDDGTIEFIDARGLSEDDKASEGIMARSAEDAEVSESIEFIEVRSTARDVDDEVTETIEIVEARDVDDGEEVGEGNEWLEARDVDDEEDVGEGNEWLEARDVDNDVTETIEVVEARDVGDEVTEDIEVLTARSADADEEDVGEGNEWLEARDAEDDEVTEDIEVLTARSADADDEDVGEGNEWLEAREAEANEGIEARSPEDDDVTETIEEVDATEVVARGIDETEASETIEARSPEEDDVTETIEVVDASDVEARSPEDDVTETIEEVGAGEVEARSVEEIEVSHVTTGAVEQFDGIDTDARSNY